MCAGRHSIAHSLSVPLCPSRVGEEEDRTGGSSVPSLDIANASQQIDVARRVLLHNVFYVVGFEGLFELAPRYEVLDLIRRSLTWSVLVKEIREIWLVCAVALAFPLTFRMNRMAILCWFVNWMHRGSSSSSVGESRRVEEEFGQTI